MFLLALIGVPIVYLAVVVMLAIRKDALAIAVSLLFACAVAATMIWSIRQSLSSTAALGYLGLPSLSALAGLLGAAFARWRTSAARARRIGAWLGLAGGLILVTLNLTGGTRTRAKENSRTREWEAQQAEIARDRESIDAVINANPSRARAYLDSAIKARLNDRAFLLAALPHDSISPTLLDTLANSPDMGITLEAVRNPSTSAETLTRIYKTHTYPDYFFQALAAHRHTPPDILRALHRNPGVMASLDRWLAGNPSTPKDVLEDIGKNAADNDVIAQLLENPALDCGLLTQVGVRLTRAPQRDPPDPNVMRATERLPDVCLAKVKL
jgi:hypothetical protein